MKSERLKKALSGIGTYKGGKYVPKKKEEDKKPSRSLTAPIKKMGNTDKTVPTSKPKATTKPKAKPAAKPKSKPAAKSTPPKAPPKAPPKSGSGVRGKSLPSNPKLKSQPVRKADELGISAAERKRRQQASSPAAMSNTSKAKRGSRYSGGTRSNSTSTKPTGPNRNQRRRRGT